MSPFTSSSASRLLQAAAAVKSLSMPVALHQRVPQVFCGALLVSMLGCGSSASVVSTTSSGGSSPSASSGGDSTTTRLAFSGDVPAELASFAPLTTVVFVEQGGVTLRVLPSAADCDAASTAHYDAAAPWLDVAIGNPLDLSPGQVIEAWSHVELHQSPDLAPTLDGGSIVVVSAPSEGPITVRLEHVELRAGADLERAFSLEGTVVGTTRCGG